MKIKGISTEVLDGCERIQIFVRQHKSNPATASQLRKLASAVKAFEDATNKLNEELSVTEGTLRSVYGGEWDAYEAIMEGIDDFLLYNT